MPAQTVTLVSAGWRVTLSDSFGERIVPHGTKKIRKRHFFVASALFPETDEVRAPQEAIAVFMQDTLSGNIADEHEHSLACDAKSVPPTTTSPAQKRRLAHRIAAEIPGLRRYARRLERNPDEAEDLVQDALERALRKSHGWRGGSLAAWLRRITFTVFANRRVRARREEADIEIDGALETASPPRQEDRLACRDIAKAVQELPREQRIAIGMAMRPESSYEESATAASMPVGTFRSRLSRAREKLREKLTAPHNRAADWHIT
jgi:RNA polymerase sigma-70 factor (ECF subfamily)